LLHTRDKQRRDLGTNSWPYCNIKCCGLLQNFYKDYIQCNSNWIWHKLTDVQRVR
jgi:hypothetical protein